MTEIEGVNVSNTPLTDSCVVLTLTQHLMGIHKQVSTDNIEIKDDAGKVESLSETDESDEDKAKKKAAMKERLNLTKKLIDHPAYQKIVSLDGDISRYVKSRSHSSKILKGGMGFVPYGILKEVVERLEAYVELRKQYVAEFITAYPEIVEASKAKLGPLANDKDFPAPDKVAGLFDANYSLTAFTTPTTLKDIAPEIFEQERKKSAASLDEATQEIVVLMRQQFAKLLDDMVARLREDPETGKKKVIKDAGIDRFNDFVKNFAALNVTNDSELAELVCKAQQMTDNTNASELRSNPIIRKVCADRFSALQLAMSALIVDKPTRAVTIGE